MQGAAWVVGDFIVPAPRFTFCISAEIFAHTSKPLAFCVMYSLCKKFNFLILHLFRPVVLRFSLYGLLPHFLSLPFPSSLLVLFNAHLILLHPEFKIRLALMTCNLQFELLTASLNKPHAKYLGNSSGRVLLQVGAHYHYA